MTESPWTAITIHRLDRSLAVQIQAETTAKAAELIDPFIAPDTIISGPETPRTQAVHALLQERRIDAAAALERAQAAHQAALNDIHRLSLETTEPQPALSLAEKLEQLADVIHDAMPWRYTGERDEDLHTAEAIITYLTTGQRP